MYPGWKESIDDWSRAKERDLAPEPLPKMLDTPCPGCGMKTLTYIGGGPKDIECANIDCQYFPERKK